MQVGVTPTPIQPPGGQLVDNSALEEDLSVAVAAVVEALGKRLRWLERPWEELPREELGHCMGRTGVGWEDGNLQVWWPLDMNFPSSFAWGSW